MRSLSESFMFDLKQGRLNKLLQMVQKDDMLCLEIRENYINVYYRGGNILKVSEKYPDYLIEFDQNYCVKGNTLWTTQPDFVNLQTINEYIDALPLLKREMDLWFYEHPKNEREAQQLILRENNISRVANDTDYYIADIEYANRENGSRFDLIGIKWASEPVSRKKCNSINIALMELKYGDRAFKNYVKHFEDMQKFISAGKLNDLIHETEIQFNQKVELGLIRKINKKIKIDTEKKPEFIILCANHKSASTVLVRESKIAIDKCNELFSKVDVRIAMANCLGYGLYERNMMNIEEFINAKC